MSAATADTVELRRFIHKGGTEEPPAAARSGAGVSYLSEASRPDDGGHARAAVEISVMLADGHSIKIDDVSMSTTANDILDTVIKKLTLDPVEARRMLGLWLVSRSLSLQLKPTHMPCQIAHKWPDTLRKFADCSAAEAEKEQPLLLLKRNVFVSRDEDLTVTDVGVLTLLAAEARVCLLSGDWPCADEQLAIRLAGSLACLQFGLYNDATHTVDHCKKHISQLLPAKVIQRTSDKHRLYEGIIIEHDKLSSSVPHPQDHNDGGGQLGDNGVAAVCQRFLNDCCELPYYGCVFFDAHVERAHKSLLKGKHQPVVIGVNASGVYILDASKREPLFGVLLTELTWEFVDACTCDEGSALTCPHTKGYCVKGKDAVPYVLLQHREPAVASGGGPGSKDASGGAADPTVRVLAVYSKSAKLIDALIDNVMQPLRATVIPQTPPASVLGEVDCVDGPSSGGGDAAAAAAQASGPFLWQERLRSSTYGCCKYNRVRSQRYSATGELLDEPAKK